MPDEQPDIGGVEVIAWPHLVGTDVDAAIAVIEAARPDLVLVTATKEGNIVSADFAVRRVRVWYDPATRLVTRSPRVG